MKKILATGSTGFICDHIVDSLLHENYIVVAASSRRGKAFNYFTLNHGDFPCPDYTALQFWGDIKIIKSIINND
ncbi:MAG: hypothetical protein ABIQ56_07315 [Chitinophagaceae bacterium]